MTSTELQNIELFIIDKCKEGKASNGSSFYKDIEYELQEKFNVNMSTEKIRYISKKYRKANGLDENFNPIGILSEDDNRKYMIATSSDAILHEHGLDPAKFELVNYRTSKWTGVDGRDCTSSKINVKPKTTAVWDIEFIQDLFKCMEWPHEIEDYTCSNYHSDGDILILPVADFHFMRYATMEFTNDIYDTETARKNFFSLILDIIERVKDRKLSKIYFIIGNDMLNCDNLSGSTTHGTPQENCDNIEHAIITLTDILVGTIERLKHIAPLEVLYVPSNHDYLTFFGIANALRIAYEKDKNVFVDASYKERKYRLEGNCLLGFAHDIKVAKVNSIMMNDAKEYISEANRRMYFLAHFHHESCEDVDGTEVRRSPSMAPCSRWEYKKGYHSTAKCQSFIINPEIGLKEILYSYM